MRIRRAASLLLGVAPSASSSSQPPRRNLPPLPPADAGGPPPCVTNMAVADLMDQLGVQDPVDDKHFKETYFWDGRPSLRRHHPWGSRCHFPATTRANSIEENEEMAVDMLDSVILEPCIVEKNCEKSKSTTTKGEEEKNKTKLKTKGKGKEKVEANESDDAGGGWPCKKNESERWFCGRPASQPNSYCSHHSDQKPRAISKPPQRKRIVANRGLDLGFCYYGGFGPSSSTKRHHGSSSVQEPVEQKEHTTLDHIDLNASLAGADDIEHQGASASECFDEPRHDDCTDVIIDGWYVEISDDDAPDYNSETVKVSKTPSKKMGKKPVKARSLKSLM
ncbi:hypothetical protein CFC21_054385 [Triticum aestivum]|uniref:WRC domain-containing protein n=2 Tax=Triticum aestivum TaxID=4565 RepID=A0A9R1GEI1_WHEAT|nr:uncharacterized protein LOC123082792 [Triticum aestivum]KAF7045263.1 hypothetical protein CFC21_054385 [Triticum aestivum]